MRLLCTISGVCLRAELLRTPPFVAKFQSGRLASFLAQNVNIPKRRVQSSRNNSLTNDKRKWSLTNANAAMVNSQKPQPLRLQWLAEIVWASLLWANSIVIIQNPFKQPQNIAVYRNSRPCSYYTTPPSLQWPHMIWTLYFQLFYKFYFKLINLRTTNHYLKQNIKPKKETVDFNGK